jgi:fructose/tagatose bisphosphate aldolase
VQAEIQEAVKSGVVKMNIDTDTQWAYWDGIRTFYKKNEGYLQGQVATRPLHTEIRVRLSSVGMLNFCRTVSEIIDNKLFITIIKYPFLH